VAPVLVGSLEVPSAHVAGFAGGSIVAQELTLLHPELVRSLVLQSTWPVMDPYLRGWLLFVRWLVEVAPSERAFLEGFFLDIYTARAHNDGTVAQFIEGCWPSRTSRRPRTCRPTRMPSSTTTPPSAYRRSLPPRWSWPVAATRLRARSCAAPLPS
jgi:pimeloyl-ACP methyl ester carboxylesterase